MKLLRDIAAAFLLMAASSTAQAGTFDLEHISNEFAAEPIEMMANRSAEDLGAGLREAQLREQATVQAAPVPTKEAEVTPTSSSTKRWQVNLVAEVGTPIRVISNPRGEHQTKTGDVDFIRVAAEIVRPGKKIFPYVAVGAWKNSKRSDAYFVDSPWYSGPWVGYGELTPDYVGWGWQEKIPRYTKFAVVGLGIRSKGNPKKGDLVLQANGGVGLTWDRDPSRTTAKHVFEGQLSASYHVTDKLAIRASVVGYGTAEGVLYTPRNRRWANHGEERLTLGVAFRF